MVVCILGHNYKLSYDSLAGKLLLTCESQRKFLLIENCRMFLLRIEIRLQSTLNFGSKYNLNISTTFSFHYLFRYIITTTYYTLNVAWKCVKKLKPAKFHTQNYIIQLQFKTSTDTSCVFCFCELFYTYIDNKH